ncbi:MAG: hypothetical protein GXP62_05335, partial [Oligoflexia bacterium]|nr:hypothetical protein [Oligoflexia bacterium]
QAALRAGHRLWFLAPEDVEITRRGKLVARVAEMLGPVPDRATLTQRLTAGKLPRRYVELPRADLLLLRLNPMTDGALAIALLAREAGVTVVNDPAGLALTRSKAWLATLVDVPRPLTTVTRSLATARMFAAELDADLVVKPAMGSGGRGVSLVQRRHRVELDRAVDQARQVGDGTVVLQEYLPEAEAGEKRLVWMDGQILGAYLRIRAKGEFRHNLRRGSNPQQAGIEDSDRKIAAALRGHLQRNGIRIAGLDVIGDKVVEVNCLNPGGVHHATDLNIANAAIQQGHGTIADQMVRLLEDS